MIKHYPLPNKIVQILSQINKTQAWLADMINMDSSQLNKIVNGKEYPSAPVQADIAQALSTCLFCELESKQVFPLEKKIIPFYQPTKLHKQPAAKAALASVAIVAICLLFYVASLFVEIEYCSGQIDVNIYKTTVLYTNDNKSYIAKAWCNWFTINQRVYKNEKYNSGS